MSSGFASRQVFFIMWYTNCICAVKTDMNFLYVLADDPAAKAKFQELSAAYESIKSGKAKCVLVLRVGRTCIAPLSKHAQMHTFYAHVAVIMEAEVTKPLTTREMQKKLLEM